MVDPSDTVGHDRTSHRRSPSAARRRGGRKNRGRNRNRNRVGGGKGLPDGPADRVERNNGKKTNNIDRRWTRNNHNPHLTLSDSKNKLVRDGGQGTSHRRGCHSHQTCGEGIPHQSPREDGDTCIQESEWVAPVNMPNYHAFDEYGGNGFMDMRNNEPVTQLVNMGYVLAHSWIRPEYHSPAMFMPNYPDYYNHTQMSMPSYPGYIHSTPTGNPSYGGHYHAHYHATPMGMPNYPRYYHAPNVITPNYAIHNHASSMIMPSYAGHYHVPPMYMRNSSSHYYAPTRTMPNYAGHYHAPPIIMPIHAGYHHASPMIMPNNVGYYHSPPIMMPNNAGYYHAPPMIIPDNSGYHHAPPSVIQAKPSKAPNLAADCTSAIERDVSNSAKLSNQVETQVSSFVYKVRKSPKLADDITRASKREAVNTKNQRGKAGTRSPATACKA